jgi:hypothetical protein
MHGQDSLMRFAGYARDSAMQTNGTNLIAPNRKGHALMQEYVGVRYPRRADQVANEAFAVLSLCIGGSVNRNVEP